MKRILLLITSLLILNVVSCNKIEKELDISEVKFGNNIVEVDNRVLPYVEEFKKECEKWDIDVDDHMKGYIGIYVDEEMIGKYGKTIGSLVTNFGFSLINKDILDNRNKVRVIVFHELGHRLGFEHCHKKCSAIMSSIGGMSSFYNVWEAQKVQMFGRVPHLTEFIEIEQE